MPDQITPLADEPTFAARKMTAMAGTILNMLDMARLLQAKSEEREALGPLELGYHNTRALSAVRAILDEIRARADAWEAQKNV